MVPGDQQDQEAVSVSGWTVKDVAGHTYQLTGTLKAGATLTVHTGRGTANKPSGHLYWGSKSYIWNNTGDTATLRTGTGGFVHKCVWGSTGSVTTCAPAPARTTKPPAPPTTRPAPTQTTTRTQPPAVPESPGDGDGGAVAPPVFG
ncbi:lamin tail domain-containing protein [Actinoplanes sp. NPDC049599]|uniref:lamin tail domain-containing protein n=1 Tax=Actinoplanes sp. NPDC049599 TaxID=3363903 RepID=UPI003788B95A